MLFHRWLLRLYPKSFRAEYGAEMLKDFAREPLWRVTIDTLVNAARVHADITKQDLRYSLRSLMRTPGFTITAIAVAALGIGATTATFSIADHVLVRPLPFADPDTLVRLSEDHSSRGYPRMEPSPPNYRDWKQMATSSFDGIEAYSGDSAVLAGQGDPVRLVGARVSSGVFAMLGRQAAHGRVLTESDVTSTADAVVISDRLWRGRFAADPNVLGQTMPLNEATLVIVGVMPPDFHFPGRDTDFWRLMRFSDTPSNNDRGNHYLAVMARLKPGVSFERARSEMRTIGDELARRYPKELSGTNVNVYRWRDDVARQPRMLIRAMVAAALCLLLIACTNLANLLMARALARRTELAVRAAIGAGSDRLVRQMFTESLVLSVVGGALGIALAAAAMPMLARLIPTTLPIAELPPIDVRMLSSAAVITIATAIAFGVLPALRVSRTADGSALREGNRGGTGRGTERLRAALVVAEIVASVVLLVSAGLLIQALMRVQAIDPGFRTENVLTLKTQLPRPQYDPSVRRDQFYRQVLDQTRALPGVAGAAYMSFVPFTVRGGIWEVLTTTPDPASPQGFVAPPDMRRASLRFMTPGYFDVIGIPIRQGRDINDADVLGAPLVAVVSESFVRQYFPAQDPIGQSFAFAFNVRTIVGVVGDIRFRGLERNDNEPQVYLPAAQQRDGQIPFYAPQDLIVRTSVPPSTLMPAVRDIIRRADPQLPITNVQTLEELLALEVAPRVVQLRVLGAFATVAFLLAAIGIHGLLAFTVSARAREIGVRIALGAKAGDILRLVLGTSAALSVLGVTIGAAVAYGAGRWMQSLLAGVDPASGPVFVAAITLSLVMAAAGSLLPAWRAVRVDPITATRTE